VLDASITAAWCFEQQGTPYTASVLQAAIKGARIFVPAIWRLEVANALIVAERRGKNPPDESAEFLNQLRNLSISVDVEGLGLAFTTILDLARRYQRSAYDASYLELALRLGLPLATKDEPLRQAAAELRVPLYVA